MPGRAPLTRRFELATALTATALTAVALLVVGCSGQPALTVAPPRGGDEQCGRLHSRLPHDLDGRDRRDTSPVSRRTAAWGQPPLVLRCGVGRPTGLTATAQVLEVQGVEWFLTERPRAYVFTTVGRTAYVELRVPRSTPRERATAPLVDLATAIDAALPRSP